MCSALGGKDGVHEGIDLLVVSVGVLERDIDVDAVPLTGEPDRGRMDGGLGPIEVLYELRHPSVVVECLLLPRALVLKVDGGLGVQECLVAEPVLESGVVEYHRLEHLLVGPECDGGTMAVGFTDILDRTVGDTYLV